VAGAQALRLAEGAVQSALRVPLNRAIVLESDEPFAELSVANPEIADIATLSERSVYVLGKQPGRTTLTLLGADGSLIANVEVRVTPDIAEFKERLGELLPGESIEVRTANDGIIVSGTVSSARKLDQALEIAERYAPERVLNLMVVGGSQQVTLKVRFAEMRRNVTKALGSNVAIGGTLFGGDVNLGTPSVAGNTVGGFGASNTLTNPNGTFTLGFPGGSVAVDLTLQALEAKGLVRTLAEPNLTALSGQPAQFLAGGEVPIPIIGDDGRVGIEYRPFGVELTFTPTVVEGDIINLKLDASVSDVSETATVPVGAGAQAFTFTKRQTTTTVELRDGQSFAVGGLLEDSFTDTVSQVPVLGDIPILGALFRSASYNSDQTELVVVITAHLVTPTRSEAIALPTDLIRPPTENDLFLRGRISGEGSYRRSTRDGALDGDLSGNYGYVLE
jgi:pilus assembly protein CpaC